MQRAYQFASPVREFEVRQLLPGQDPNVDDIKNLYPWVLPTTYCAIRMLVEKPEDYQARAYSPKVPRNEDGEPVTQLVDIDGLSLTAAFQFYLDMVNVFVSPGRSRRKPADLCHSNPASRSDRDCGDHPELHATTATTAEFAPLGLKRERQSRPQR